MTDEREITEPAPLTPEDIERLLARHPDIAERVRQDMLITLHSRGTVTIDEIYKTARRRARRTMPEKDAPSGDNVQVARRWDDVERRHIQNIVVEQMAAHSTLAEIEDLINLTRKRREAQSLEEIASLSSVSFKLLADKVRAFCRLPRGQTRLSKSESMSVRVALIRNFISQQLQFHGVAKHYLQIRDFDDLVGRIIGEDAGNGLIGGKAGGMLLGAKILQREMARDPDAPKIAIHTPESFFLRSDVIETFMQENGLQHLQDHKYKDLDEIRNDYLMLQELIKNATFPERISKRLETVLDRVGTHPLIVRSSSLLEDRFGTTFAGMYRSVFVCNQGTKEERLTELTGAIAEVYASSLHPDPISYRRRHDLLDFDEKMAVLIQKVVGIPVGPYYFPVWAGVGFSQNIYRRNPRIRPEDGMARIVFGLGTRAVDRVGNDQPRIIPLGLPALRAEVSQEDVIRAAQTRVDLVNLETNSFETHPVADVLAAADRIPGLAQACSLVEHGFLRPLVGDAVLVDPEDLVVTFDKFAGGTPYPALLKWCLTTLQRVYGCPVDIEFAFDGKDLHLLQCRPQAMPRSRQAGRVPSDVPSARRVFSGTRDVVGGSVKDIEYIVLIDPRDYNSIGSDDLRLEIAAVVRRLNRRLADQRFILMGPGRWGSRDLRMGIHVTYSDIDNTRMLIEIARKQGGYTPDVSFGSHFFQDLVESDIAYLALFPDEDESRFNEALLHDSPNALATLLPEAAIYASVVRVIHVPAVSGGAMLQVEMDEDSQQALGYLTEATTTA
jgi:pyruvate, water dikinase